MVSVVAELVAAMCWWWKSRVKTRRRRGMVN
jgi:hypothetical protein